MINPSEFLTQRFLAQNKGLVLILGIIALPVFKQEVPNVTKKFLFSSYYIFCMWNIYCSFVLDDFFFMSFFKKYLPEKLNIYTGSYYVTFIVFDIKWENFKFWWIDWLVFNANFSSISAILWHELLLKLVLNTNQSIKFWNSLL